MPLKYEFEVKNQSFIMNFTPAIEQCPSNIYKICAPDDSYWPIQHYTATTDMIDGIGNVTKIDTNICDAKLVWRGVMQNKSNVKIYDKSIKNIGDRIMVTEHINVNGHIDYIATKKRILKNNANFINFGWSNSEQSIYYRVDIYTGEFIEIHGPANYMYWRK